MYNFFHIALKFLQPAQHFAGLIPKPLHGSYIDSHVLSATFRWNESTNSSDCVSRNASHDTLSDWAAFSSDQGIQVSLKLDPFIGCIIDYSLELMNTVNNTEHTTTRVVEYHFMLGIWKEDLYPDVELDNKRTVKRFKRF